MTHSTHDPYEIPEEELARLADGSLPADQRERLAAAAAASPCLTEALGEQRRALTAMDSLHSVQAPPALRRRLEEAQGSVPAAAGSEGAVPARRPLLRRRSLRPALATALALVLVVLVMASRGGLTMAQAVRVALEPATGAAPAADPAHPGLLRTSVDGIAFPTWTSLQWSASGSRSTTIGGREVTAVYYSGADGYRVGYAIVSGAAVAVPRGQVMDRWYTVLRSGDEVAVTWRRAGHTCVIAARGVSAQTLVTLARDDTA